MTGGLYALFACGLSLLFGVMKVVNLAHGDLAVVGAYIGLGVIAVTHMPFLWSIPIMVVLMAALGYALQRSVIQTALNKGELATLIVTFGLSIVIENGLQQFFSANTPRHRHRVLAAERLVLDRLADPDRVAPGRSSSGWPSSCCSPCSTSCPHPSTAA